MKKILPLIVALSCVFGASTRGVSLPEKVRVLSVDLGGMRVETPGAPGSELSQDIRRLLETADVDLICVQGALDWENCERLAQLRPGFQVLTCSAFEKSPQLAILCRSGAVLSWVEEIEEGSGFALAIVQVGSHKLGVFSAESAKSTTPPTAAAVERILKEVKKLQKFPQNRPDSFLVAGAGLVKSTVLTDNAFQTVPAEPAVDGGSEFYVRNAGFLTRPRRVPFKGIKTAAVLSDFDTGSSFSSKFAYQTPLLLPGETLAAYQAAMEPPKPPVKEDRRMLVWGLTGGGVLLLFLVLLFPRRARPAGQLLPVPAGHGLTPVDDPVRSNLLAWLKSAFLQRLLSQRQQLLNDEAEATRRTMVIEEKLSNLQSALQTRISAYEARIERLEQELTAATLDNRELIRAQIELLKEKVAKAKQEHALGRN